MTDDTRDTVLPDPAMVSEDSPVYQPPAGAEETDLADAAVDGTSASHYGANDPALYKNSDRTNQD
ncbi:hypothetical protein GCM10008955_42170 [Deinococcus malanensis]|uniref:Uncharacterized protein n=1 Tax=Deinococcus malanensis TaxID=1706855 RepID=A0ABQ2F2B5_9DEIO|nr:hypothetical protein [Deinococcus malanensis]GGK43984.1 hypothetical protein GCM10008955_42170 [Deinococcus malanensis]